MKRDKIVDGGALPRGMSKRDVRATELAAATANFIKVCEDAPGPKGGMRHISVFIRCTQAALELRRSLNRFCDASGVERL